MEKKTTTKKRTIRETAVYIVDGSFPSYSNCISINRRLDVTDTIYSEQALISVIKQTIEKHYNAMIRYNLNGNQYISYLFEEDTEYYCVEQIINASVIWNITSKVKDVNDIKHINKKQIASDVLESLFNGRAMKQFERNRGEHMFTYEADGFYTNNLYYRYLINDKVIFERDYLKLNAESINYQISNHERKMIDNFRKSIESFYNMDTLTKFYKILINTDNNPKQVIHNWNCLELINNDYE